MRQRTLNIDSKQFNIRNSFTGFSIFVAVICILNIVLNAINGRFWLSDFKVYYMAARTLTTSGQVYLQSFADGSGFYKYSPVILLYFLPFTLLSYTAASVIHFFILGFASWYTFLVIRKIFTIYFPFGSVRHEGLLLSLSFVCILLHLVRELYLGNINILLLMLCTLSLRNYLSGKPLPGSILLGIVVLTKPFFLILIIPLVFRKYRKALSLLSIVLFMGLILPFLYPGPSKSVILYTDWFRTMMNHDQGFPGMNSIDYLLAYYFGLELSPGYMTFLVILATGSVFSLFVLRNTRLEAGSVNRDELAKRNFIFEWFLIIAMIPSIVKTDSEHFLATAPLFIFMIYYIAARKKYFLVPVLLGLFFFYGGNSYDLLGRELSLKLFSMGLLGLSNLLLVILSLVLYLDLRNKDPYSG